VVFEKVHIEQIEDNMYLEPIKYHRELFHGSMRLINEVKELLPQENIPQNMLSRIKSGSAFASSSYDYYTPEESLSLENASQLLSSLEILLCFLKRTEVCNGEMLITDYIEQWSLLSEMTQELGRILQVGLQLKHIVALYELVEDKVADVVVSCVDGKYKAELSSSMESDIMGAVWFDPQTQIHGKRLLPAEAFATALKRFILRYLSEELIKPDIPLSCHINEASLNCWPPSITEEMLEELFPDSLLIQHTFEAYQFTKQNIQKWANKRNSSAGMGPSSRATGMARNQKRTNKASKRFDDM